MKQYLDLLKDVLDNGDQTEDRTGVGTRAVFGREVRYDLTQGFPLLTTKKLFFKAIVVELLWFLKGDTNVKYLQDNGVKIWNEWADANGELGPVYGKQWRSWGTYDEGNGCADAPIDQIADVINQIKKNPTSRRLIVSAWNPTDIPHMKLPPCHCLFQFKVMNGKLSCKLTQRSADIFLGVPWNIACYSLLTMMIAQICDLQPGEFIHSLGDLHLYNNHFNQAHIQLKRTPKKLPTVKLNPLIKDIDQFTLNDFTLENYEADPSIKADVAV